MDFHHNGKKNKFRFGLTGEKGVGITRRCRLFRPNVFIIMHDRDFIIVHLLLSIFLLRSFVYIYHELFSSSCL